MARYVHQPHTPTSVAVVDTHDEDRILATCKERSDAILIAQALNFNYRPQDYDYKFMPNG